MRELASARYYVQAGRRPGQPLGEAATTAATRYLGCAKAADEADAQLRTAWLRHETTLDQYETAERAAAEAWERYFLAAVDLDALLPGESASAHVRLMAEMQFEVSAEFKRTHTWPTTPFGVPV